MRRLFLLSFCLLFLLCGCGKVTSDSLKKDFVSKVNKSKSYELKGSMEIVNNEETFNYSLEVKYLKDNYYKVVLVNQTNNHEQIILRNADGVYVITPSLNKSFKFQSDWPYNSSQAYILASIVNDLKNDEQVKLEQSENNYVLISKVNYPNNEELTYQKVIFDKNMNLEEVEVYNNENLAKIKVKFTDINYKAGLDTNDFLLEDLIEENCCLDKENCDNSSCNQNSGNNELNEENKKTEETQSKDKEEKTSNIDNVIYPLYIPANTFLELNEKIDTDNGERAILTFSGEKDFVLIEEKAISSSEFEVIPVYGDPQMVNDTVAAMSANSLSWVSDDMEYYLASDVLSKQEMLTIAGSLNGTKLVMESK